MTTERTLRITNEMAVHLAKILFDSDRVFWVSRARDALKAVLEPCLDRRAGDRRTHITGKDLGNGLYTGPHMGTSSRVKPDTQGVNDGAHHSAQEQSGSPGIHVSGGMRDAGIKQADNCSYTNVEAMENGAIVPARRYCLEPSDFDLIHRAMESQRRKDRGWDGTGPGGA